MAHVTAPEAPVPAMTPARSQGGTSQTPDISHNNTNGTNVDLRHVKLSLPFEIHAKSTSQQEETTHKKSEVQENILENQSDLVLEILDEQTQDEKNYICVNCGKSFGLWSSLLRHTSTDCGVKPHSCSECGASFKYPSQLLAHQSMHSGLKPYECTTCGKSFARKFSLEVHVRIHTGEKPFICNLCNKGFVEQGKLRKHLRVHTGDKPFRCDGCGNCYTDYSVLIRHQRMYCPTRNRKSNSHLIGDNLIDCSSIAGTTSEYPITGVQGRQVCHSPSFGKDKIVESGLGNSWVVVDAQVPTVEKVYNASGTFQESFRKEMEPLNTSGELVNELLPTAEHGGTRYWSVKPVPNTHGKDVVNDE
ncbi:zinc finger protein 2-like [Eleutherodactylus coqui]|uniref:zinc finger protein 2-like n=1 Tax=Eleutherodactylus coqui TaxID=57060 RepID=UPI0034631245